MAAPSPPVNMPGHCDREPIADGMLAVTILFFAMVTILMPLRIYARVFVFKAFGWDDATWMFAYICLIPASALIWRLWQLDFGLDYGCISPALIAEQNKTISIAQIMAVIVAMVARLAAAFFVLRIFGVKKWLKTTLYVHMIGMCIVIIITEVLTAISCTPIRKGLGRRDSTICWSHESLLAITGISGGVSIWSDFILALLPAYFLRTMQMDRKHKIALASLFSLSLVPCICTCLRLYFTLKLIVGDVTIHNAASAEIAAYMENTFLLICSAVPAIFPLIGRNKDRSPSTEPLNRDFEKRPVELRNHRSNTTTSSHSNNMHVEHVPYDFTSHGGSESQMQLSNAQGSEIWKRVEFTVTQTELDGMGTKF